MSADRIFMIFHNLMILSSNTSKNSDRVCHVLDTHKHLGTPIGVGDTCRKLMHGQTSSSFSLSKSQCFGFYLCRDGYLRWYTNGPGLQGVVDCPLRGGRVAGTEAREYLPARVLRDGDSETGVYQT